jgi:hypothetical protein
MMMSFIAASQTSTCQSVKSFGMIAFRPGAALTQRNDSESLRKTLKL